MTRSGEKCRLERIASAEILKNAIQGLATKCVDGISAKEHRCRFYANATISVAAALNPYIGYVSAAEIAKESVRTRRPVAKNCSGQKTNLGFTRRFEGSVRRSHDSSSRFGFGSAGVRPTIFCSPAAAQNCRRDAGATKPKPRKDICTKSEFRLQLT